MNFEDAADMANLYNISPDLTCTCDEFHLCQQCHEEEPIKKIKTIKNETIRENIKEIIS
jgi:hypothetical protein